MNLRHALDSSFGFFCYSLAVSMFFFFPGVEAWTFSAFHPVAVSPQTWIHLLLVFLVVVPAVVGPLVFIARAQRYGRLKLGLGCISLAALFMLAGSGVPLLYGRVALNALLAGQLLALGRKAEVSVPFNWMAFLGYIIANVNFPDQSILHGANFLAGAYLLVAGYLVLAEKWKPDNQPRSRVMVG